MLSGCSSQPARPTIPAIERFLDRLPPDIESIIVYEDSIGEEYLETGLFDLEDSPLAAPRVAELASWVPLISLVSVGIQGKEIKSIWDPVFSGQVLKYGVIAARRFQNFRPPEGGPLPMGIIAYQGCGLISLTSPLSEIPLLESGGGNALITEASQSRRPRGYAQSWSKHYVGQLEEGVVLVCNDSELFQDILGEDTTGGTAPVVNHLRSQRRTSQAPVVGVRSFRLAGQDDPTNPLNYASDAFIHDVKAKSFVMEAGSDVAPVRLSWYTDSISNVWGPFANDAGLFDHTLPVEQIRGGWRVTLTNPGDMLSGVVEGRTLMGFLEVL